MKFEDGRRENGAEGVQSQILCLLMVVDAMARAELGSGHNHKF